MKTLALDRSSTSCVAAPTAITYRSIGPRKALDGARIILAIARCRRGSFEVPTAQISPAAIDRRTGEPGDLRHQSQTAPPGRPHLNRRNNRCPRSSSFEPTAAQRCRMASSSIVRPIYACSPRTGIPKTRVTPPHDARLRFSYCSSRPKRLIFFLAGPAAEISRSLCE
jgi:hypothetical protein